MSQWRELPYCACYCAVCDLLALSLGQHFGEHVHPYTVCGFFSPKMLHRQQIIMNSDHWPCPLQDSRVTGLSVDARRCRQRGERFIYLGYCWGLPSTLWWADAATRTKDCSKCSFVPTASQLHKLSATAASSSVSVSVYSSTLVFSIFRQLMPHLTCI